jgi:hypothetical protein
LLLGEFWTAAPAAKEPVDLTYGSLQVAWLTLDGGKKGNPPGIGSRDTEPQGKLAGVFFFAELDLHTYRL